MQLHNLGGHGIKNIMESNERKRGDASKNAIIVKKKAISQKSTLIFQKNKYQSQ